MSKLDSRHIGLRRIGRDEKRAVPALLNALDTTNLEAWTTVLESLRALDASNEAVIGKVRQKLNAEDEGLRLAAAEQVLKSDHADQQAQTVLVALIKSHSVLEPEAIRALARQGQAGSSNIPVILSALDGDNPESWVEVPQALTGMGAPAKLFLPKLEEKIQNLALFGITRIIGH